MTISALVDVLTGTAAISAITAVVAYFWEAPLPGLGLVGRARKIYGVACMVGITAATGAVLLAVLAHLNRPAP